MDSFVKKTNDLYEVIVGGENYGELVYDGGRDVWVLKPYNSDQETLLSDSLAESKEIIISRD